MECRVEVRKNVGVYVHNLGRNVVDSGFFFFLWNPPFLCYCLWEFEEEAKKSRLKDLAFVLLNAQAQLNAQSKTKQSSERLNHVLGEKSCVLHRCTCTSALVTWIPFLNNLHSVQRGGAQREGYKPSLLGATIGLCLVTKLELGPHVEFHCWAGLVLLSNTSLGGGGERFDFGEGHMAH